MGKILPVDLQTTTTWAVASLRSVGGGEALGGSITLFDLVNRITGRAHKLQVVSGGVTFGFPITGSFSSSDYAYFHTRRPVSFTDFNGVVAGVGSINLIYYSLTRLTLKDGTALFSPTLADVRMSGTGWNLPSAGGEPLGWATVLWGNGRPVNEGDVVETVIDLDLPSGPEDVHQHLQITQQDDWMVIKISGDALFDFDKSNIKSAAEGALKQAGSLIRVRHPRRVKIEGHTDSIGDDRYNQPLSERRAKAVAQWLASHKYLNSKIALETPGLGKSTPVAPNQRPDGSDDPIGRAKNRRVEIYLIK